MAEVEIVGFQGSGGVKMEFYYKDEAQAKHYPGALQLDKIFVR
jgi:hypothetical protein